MNLIDPGDAETLTIADLARRLGVTPATARLRAKHAARLGECRISRGGGPNDPVLIKVLPVRSVDAAAEPKLEPETDLGPKPLSPPTPEMLGLAGRVLTYLEEAQSRNRDLVAQLAQALEAHRRDAAELVAAETREMATREELDRALDELALLRGKLAQLQQPWWQRRRS